MENGGGLGGSHRGGKMATAAIGNAPVRAAVSRSSAWMRGGSLGHARRRAREGKGEASTAASGSFLKRRWRGRGGGGGSEGGCHVEGGNGEERGGPGHSVGQRGGHDFKFSLNFDSLKYVFPYLKNWK
jgi:hypothetical protein